MTIAMRSAARSVNGLKVRLEVRGNRKALISTLKRPVDPQAAARLRYILTQRKGPVNATARIHPYAGMGHQLSGWMSALLWSADLGLPFLHPAAMSPLMPMLDLTATARKCADAGKKGARTVKLPLVGDERDARSVPILASTMIRTLELFDDIEPITFQFALDQPRWSHVEAAGTLRDAYLAAGPNRDQVDRSSVTARVALHIRRGDVSSAMSARWVDVVWYERLVTALRDIPALSQAQYEVICQADSEDFAGLTKLGVNVRSGESREADFNRMASADVLVAAPSSFSFSAALASKGMAIVRTPWWHRVPDFGRWVAVDGSEPPSPTELARGLREAKLS